MDVNTNISTLKKFDIFVIGIEFVGTGWMYGAHIPTYGPPYSGLPPSEKGVEST